MRFRVADKLDKIYELQREFKSFTGRITNLFADMKDQIQLLHESVLARYAETITIVDIRVEILRKIKSKLFSKT